MQKKSIFFVSLPKSGTVYTWSAVSQVTGLKIPEFHKLVGWNSYTAGRDFSCPELYACGDYNSQLLRPDQMKLYIHDYLFGAHMQASYHNMKVLEESGINRIVVLLRDPRDAFVSWVYHLGKLASSARNYHSKIYHIPGEYYSWTLDKQFDFQIRSFHPTIINWVEGWLDYYASLDRNIDVLFVLYDELKRDPLKYVQKIVTFNQFQGADYSKIPHPQKGKMHYRKGEHNQWKLEFSPENLQLVENLLQHRIPHGFERAARAHEGMNQSKNELAKGKVNEAMKAAFSTIVQFPNSLCGYDLFFKAASVAGLDISHQQKIVQNELASLALEDYFIYREQLVQICKNLLGQIDI